MARYIASRIVPVMRDYIGFTAATHGSLEMMPQRLMMPLFDVIYIPFIDGSRQARWLPATPGHRRQPSCFKRDDGRRRGDGPPHAGAGADDIAAPPRSA